MVVVQIWVTKVYEGARVRLVSCELGLTDFHKDRCVIPNWIPERAETDKIGAL